MYILLDIEWAEKWRKSFLTQIAAIRVNENWEKQDSFSRLVSPPQPEKAKWQHVAFSGHDPADFLNAADEATVLASFREWLQEDDVLCFWHYEARMFFERLWKKHMPGSFSHRGKVAYHRVYYRLQNQQGEMKSLYDYAQELGIETPSQRHVAANDVVVMWELLNHIYTDWHSFEEKVPKMPSTNVATQKKKPQSKKQKAKGNKNPSYDPPTEKYFFFTEESNVFHKKNCTRMPKIKEIQGSSYYGEVSMKRRPCKICNPQPQDGRSFNKAMRYVRFFDGTSEWEMNRNIVGYCHFQGHPGEVSKKLLLQHGCVEKQCNHLQKYPQCSFWKLFDSPEGMAILEKMQLQDQRYRWTSDYLKPLREEFQSYLADFNHRVLITRIVKKNSQNYRLICVSDDPMEDQKLFPMFLDRVHAVHPKWFISLWHAKNAEGNYMTVDDYYAQQGA